MEADLITAVEAQKILGISSSTLHRWVNSGKLPEAIKVPGLRGPRLFHRADVEAHVAHDAEVAAS